MINDETYILVSRVSYNDCDYNIFIDLVNRGADPTYDNFIVLKKMMYNIDIFKYYVDNY